MCCTHCKSCDSEPVPLPQVVAHEGRIIRAPDPDPVATQPMPPAWSEPAVPPNFAKEFGTRPPKVLPRSYLMWLAVDLDSTLAQGVWTPEEPTSEIGDPIWANVVKVRVLAAKGWKIVIHTSRPWHDYEAIEVWANHYKVPFSRIVCGKLLAAAYIDDRAINADDPDWAPRSHDARTA